ncbi:MAG TPA: extracellular solute-binding protein [Rhizomicrobium sp.]|nr:extracellular solute-binding protein [Rhizomicrobium sp.]
MRIVMLSAGLMLFSFAAQAAEITVLAPGLIGPGFATLAEQWKAQTGNSAVLGAGAGTVGRIQQAIAEGRVADLVLLPPNELAGMADKLKPGSERKIGRVVFGLAVKSGTPHPDISTAEKFRAALKGKRVAYNDPAIGSLAGKMVDALLKQPEYAGVIAGPSTTQGGVAVADGKADMAVAVETEEVLNKGIDIVGPVPDGIGLTITMSGAVPANAAHPDEAAAFLAFITRPEAAAVFKPTGIAIP